MRTGNAQVLVDALALEMLRKVIQYCCLRYSPGTREAGVSLKAGRLKECRFQQGKMGGAELAAHKMFENFGINHFPEVNYTLFAEFYSIAVIVT